MINLEKTNFELKEMVNELPDTLHFKKDKLISVRDFGTVFIGPVEPKHISMSLPQDGAPTFCAPEKWKMAQLLKALGAFKSSSQAAKNGWNIEIPAGVSSFVVKINKVKGEVWIHKEHSVKIAKTIFV